MTANLPTLTKEKRELQMKRHLLPTTALSMRRVVFTILCCTLLLLFAAPAWADPCTAPTVGTTPAGSVGSATGCGLLITVTGSSGSLVATLTGGGTANGNPYDGAGGDDILVGIQNNSSVAVGAIVLSAPLAETDNPFQFDGDGPCDPLYNLTPYTWCPAGYPVGSNDPNPVGYEGPDNTFVGISPDFTTGKVLFTTPLPPGGSTWFGLDRTPTNVVAIGENKPLTAGSTTIFPFGPFAASGAVDTEKSGQDDIQITPLNSASGDTLTVTAVPVPAGPLGLDTWGPGFFGSEGPLPSEPPSGQLRFSATNYPNLACVPYADFSTAAGNPVCIELELDCPAANSDACSYVYTAQNDFDIDKNSLLSGIGGAALLVQHGVDCPTTGFNQNIFLSYTGSVVGDPVLGSGAGTRSCYAVAFDPTAAQVPTGTTVSTFTGFEFPVLDNPHINPIFPLEFLNWDYDNSSGVPVTNLHLCKNSNGTGCTTPWVYLSLTALSSTAACQAVAAASSPLPSFLNSGLLNFGKGEYQFIWYAVTNIRHLAGCKVAVVLQFDSGLVVAPATFIYP
jgi:hypothetical protein